MMDGSKKQKAQKPFYQRNPRNSHRQGNRCEMDDPSSFNLSLGYPLPGISISADI